MIHVVVNRLLLVTAIAASLCGAPAYSAEPSTRPAIANGWDSSLFEYKRPSDLVIEQSSPTPAQLSFRGRPPLQGTREPTSRQVNAKPVKVNDVEILRLRFKDMDGDSVPALLCTPAGKAGPFPLVVAIHGMNSNKAQVCGQLAPNLTKLGFAVLAPDMPVHGERPGAPGDLMAKKDWLTAFQLHHRAVIDIRECIDVAETLPELDLSHGVILAGYSMGSWLNSIAGPADPRVKAMVLMVGGATDTASILKMIPQLAAADPLLAIQHFTGPLLMLNGEQDTVVTPAMANRLYTAAPEPKSQRWYGSGHRLPASAYKDAAEWIRKTYDQIVVR